MRIPPNAWRPDSTKKRTQNTLRNKVIRAWLDILSAIGGLTAAGCIVLQVNSTSIVLIGRCPRSAVCWVARRFITRPSRESASGVRCRLARTANSSSPNRALDRGSRSCPAGVYVRSEQGCDARRLSSPIKSWNSAVSCINWNRQNRWDGLTIRIPPGSMRIPSDALGRGMCSRNYFVQQRDTCFTGIVAYSTRS